MIPAISTTHAVPQKLLSAGIHVTRSRMIICHHCCQVLGRAEGPGERERLRAAHVCKEKLMDQQPAAAVPFN